METVVAAMNSWTLLMVPTFYLANRVCLCSRTRSPWRFVITMAHTSLSAGMMREQKSRKRRVAADDPEMFRDCFVSLAMAEGSNHGDYLLPWVMFGS